MPFSTPESRAFLASQLTRQEFEKKLIKFIRDDLGCDLRDGNELLRYDNNEFTSHVWILAIEKDDLAN